MTNSAGSQLSSHNRSQENIDYSMLKVGLKTAELETIAYKINCISLVIVLVPLGWQQSERKNMVRPSS